MIRFGRARTVASADSVAYRRGDFAEALRQYQTYRQLVLAELGLPPSPQFRALVAPLPGCPLDRST